MYKYEKYVTDKYGLKNMIDNYGVAIIPSVFDDIECEKMVSGIWDYFEHITQKWEKPLKRSDSNTWKEIYKLYPLHAMLIQYFSIGHSQISWDVRQNEKILDIFETFWECKKEELYVSFDGLSFHLPPEITKRGWNRDNIWYHTDQSFTRNNFECVQSWITGIDVNEGDATLAFMEGSNKFHKEFSEYFEKKEKSDWYKLDKNEEAWYYQKGCENKKIKCPKGSIVFWDSRTIHCGAEAIKGRSNPNIRAVIYLCYTPSIMCNEKNRKKRIDAFESLRTCNHVPHKIKLFGKSPRTYGGPLPEITNIDKPLLSSIGYKLIGYK
jgi:hypothetical protein